MSRRAILCLLCVLLASPGPLAGSVAEADLGSVLLSRAEIGGGVAADWVLAEPDNKVRPWTASSLTIDPADDRRLVAIPGMTVGFVAGYALPGLGEPGPLERVTTRVLRFADGSAAQAFVDAELAAGRLAVGRGSEVRTPLDFTPFDLDLSGERASGYTSRQRWWDDSARRVTTAYLQRSDILLGVEIIGLSPEKAREQAGKVLLALDGRLVGLSEGRLPRRDAPGDGPRVGEPDLGALLVDARALWPRAHLVQFGYERTDDPGLSYTLGYQGVRDARRLGSHALGLNLTLHRASSSARANALMRRFRGGGDELSGFVTTERDLVRINRGRFIVSRLLPRGRDLVIWQAKSKIGDEFRCQVIAQAQVGRDIVTARFVAPSSRADCAIDLRGVAAVVRRQQSRLRATSGAPPTP